MAPFDLVLTLSECLALPDISLLPFYPLLEKDRESRCYGPCDEDELGPRISVSNNAKNQAA
jgi:hypothetical protein